MIVSQGKRPSDEFKRVFQNHPGAHFCVDQLEETEITIVQ